MGSTIRSTGPGTPEHEAGIPAQLSQLARLAMSQPLLGPGELEQILIRLDQMTDLLRTIEANTRPPRIAG